MREPTRRRAAADRTECITLSDWGCKMLGDKWERGVCGKTSAQGSKRGESQAVYGKQRNALLLTVCLSHKSFAGVEKIYFFADNDSIRDNEGRLYIPLWYHVAMQQKYTYHPPLFDPDWVIQGLIVITRLDALFEMLLTILIMTTFSHHHHLLLVWLHMIPQSQITMGAKDFYRRMVWNSFSFKTLGIILYVPSGIRPSN